MVAYISLGIGVAIGALLTYVCLIHPLLLSPLAKVPNAHWTSAFSPLWIQWTRYRHRELEAVLKAHRNLGPIVRLGPTDLSVNSYKDGIRIIYGGGFDKSSYFNHFNYYGRTNSFCSLRRNEHSFHIRRISAVYTKSSLINSSQLAKVTEIIIWGRLFPVLLQYESTSQPAEGLELSYSLCLDLIGCFLFGHASGPNFLEQRGAYRTWVEHYECRFSERSFWPQELPRLTRCLESIGINMLPREHAKSTEYLEKWAMGMCDKADRFYFLAEKGQLQDCEDEPIVYQQVKKAVENDLKEADSQTKRLEIASELFDHMTGAREVFGLAMGFTIYFISHSLAQDRLRSELLSLRPAMTSITGSNDSAQGQIPSPSSLENLPYLSAVLKESLRMRPNSTLLPRVTPTERSVSLAGIGGIPLGTRVNSFQWFVHRNPDHWEHVDQWMPERWLSDSGKDPGRLWAFGSGPRMCVGMHLSLYLMRYVLAFIFSNFTTRVVQEETFGRHPPGSLEDRLMVKFERLKDFTPITT